MKQLSALLLAVLLALSLTGCAANSPEPPSSPPNEVSSPLPEEPEAPEPPEPEPLSLRDAFIQDCLETMSIEEKVGQLFFVRCPAAGAAEDIARYHLGGILLFGRDFSGQSPERVKETLASYQKAADLPLLLGVDEEGGTVARVSRNEALWPHPFASPQKLWQEGGLDRIAEDTIEKCGMLREYGINVNFAPVADVSTNPEDFIYSRSLGQDAQTTAEYTCLVTDTMAAEGVGAVLKHFPGYGNNEDTHGGIAVDERPYQTFVEQDFLPFQSAMGSANTAVLVSHTIVRCMDGELPASLSPAVHRILREELGYKGVILTDDLSMGAIDAYGSAAVLALQAGNDMLVTTDYARQIPQVLEAIEDGSLTEDTINQALTRVLGWKYEISSSFS